MITKILDGLKQIEEREDIIILYACESGSRAWGFDSKDSDYDVRFFYVRSQEKYNTVFPTNYATLTLDDNHSDIIKELKTKDLDYVGHDIKKALYLISKGNPDVISWLYSPIEYLTSKTSIAVKEQAERFFNTQAGLYHYAHMASKNFSQYIVNRKDQPVKLKKYLYVIRPLICCIYIDNYSKPPISKFDECLKAIESEISDPDAIYAIKHLIEIKKSGNEMGYGTAIPILNDFCSYYIDIYMNKKKIIPTTGQWTELDELFHKIILTQGGTHGSYLSPC